MECQIFIWIFFATIGITNCYSNNNYYFENHKYCDDLSPYYGEINLDQISGVWYGVEKIPHTKGEYRVEHTNECFYIDIKELYIQPTPPTPYPPLTNSPYVNRAYGYQEQFRIRHFVLEWHEGMWQDDYHVKVNTSHKGFWPTDLYSVVLSRNENQLTPQDLASIHNIFSIKNLSTSALKLSMSIALILLSFALVPSAVGVCGDDIMWSHQVNIDDVYGIWYGVGYAQHNPDMTNRPNDVGCVTLYISDASEDNPWSHNSLAGSWLDIRLKRRAKRHVSSQKRIRVLWDEDGHTMEQVYLYYLEEPGFWTADTSTTWEREMSSRGIVTPYTLILNHCSEIGDGGIFSLVLRRSPSRVERWEWYDYQRQFYSFSLPNVYRYSALYQSRIVACIELSRDIQTGRKMYILFTIGFIISGVNCASYQRYGETTRYPSYTTIANLYNQNQFPYKSNYGSDIASFPEVTRYPNYNLGRSTGSPNVYTSPGSGNAFFQPGYTTPRYDAGYDGNYQSNGYMEQNYGPVSPYERPFMQFNNDYCVNRTPQNGIWIESLTGMWYGVEFIQHLAELYLYTYKHIDGDKEVLLQSFGQQHKLYLQNIELGHYELQNNNAYTVICIRVKNIHAIIMGLQGWCILRVTCFMYIITVCFGEEISNTANSTESTPVLCAVEHKYDDLDVRTVLGKWGVVELYMHLKKEGITTYKSCPKITIWEAISAKFRQEYRHLRLLWDEAGQTIEYALYFRNDSAGYWQAFDVQNVRPSYKQFTGTVQVLKAVNDHLVLNFCQEATVSSPAQLYSVLFSREPGQMARWEIDSVHSMLQNKKLSVASRRMVCGNNAARNVVISQTTFDLIYSFNKIKQLIIINLSYFQCISYYNLSISYNCIFNALARDNIT
ncbi:unnamed protein product [Leptidea sinapis]|uniref:Lipocalin/cytosolic fatty-acid binding domain-containing protein n=1 Tax=Leptidea sinapis TaxID=189913 RepID=A0A5E4PS67_9NEOP|nr:unnamed protein product [Leptidea sinapis]